MEILISTLVAAVLLGLARPMTPRGRPYLLVAGAGIVASILFLGLGQLSLWRTFYFLAYLMDACAVILLICAGSGSGVAMLGREVVNAVRGL